LKNKVEMKEVGENLRQTSWLMNDDAHTEI